MRTMQNHCLAPQVVNQPVVPAAPVARSRGHNSLRSRTRPCGPTTSLQRAGSPLWPVQPQGAPLPLTVCHSTDYVASQSDEGVLRYPPRTELSANEIIYVFGWARNLTEKYFIGRVIGEQGQMWVHQVPHKYYSCQFRSGGCRNIASAAAILQRCWRSQSHLQRTTLT